MSSPSRARPPSRATRCGRRPDQRRRRPARAARSRWSSRTTQSNQNTIVADYNALISQDKVDLLLGTFSSLLNLPASAVAERNRMLYVEPAGGAPDIFNRGFKYALLRAAGDGRPPGRRVGELGHPAARGRAPEDGRLPDARRPVRAADLRGHRGDPRRRPGSRPSTARRYTIDRPNFDAIANAVKAKNPDLVVARRDRSRTASA